MFTRQRAETTPAHPCHRSDHHRPLYSWRWQAGDDFTSELVRIHEIIEEEGGPRQPVCLAINRSDYMLHVPEDGVTAPHLLQVSLACIMATSCYSQDQYTRTVEHDMILRKIVVSERVGMDIGTSAVLPSSKWQKRVERRCSSVMPTYCVCVDPAENATIAVGGSKSQQCFVITASIIAVRRVDRHPAEELSKLHDHGNSLHVAE